MAAFDRKTMQQKIGYANFTDNAVEICALRGTDPSEICDPDISENITQEVHKKLGVDWTYGGWMENREKIWSKTYLRDTDKFLHLGVDCSVGPGVKVLALGSGPIVHVGTDSPLEGGWGGHVVQLINFREKIYALIYAHLGTIFAKPNEYRIKGSLIGVIGDKTVNGYWSPHSHHQLVADPEDVGNWAKFLDEEIDGYGEVSRRDYWAKRCPDPTPLIL